MGFLVVRRLVGFVIGLSLVSAAQSGSPAQASAPEAARTDTTMHVTRVFSPNGDGVKDLGAVRLTLPQTAHHVALKISSASHPEEPLRTVKLGLLRKGRHVWKWNGRTDTGRQLGDGKYLVAVSGNNFAPLSAEIIVDTRFAPVLAAATYGAQEGTEPAVYPRTTVVRDTLELHVWPVEPSARRLALTIRDRRGRVVFHVDAPGYRPFVAYWSGRLKREPLPPGRYRAVVGGVDRAGNRASTAPQPIRVARKPLVWLTSTLDASPQETVQDHCTFYGYDCGVRPAPCVEVVTSARYPEGLSYRSRSCTPSGRGERYDQAEVIHHLQVPPAAGVRGVAAAKVAFAGTPTTDGEADRGTLWLTGNGMDSSAASGQTAAETLWVHGPEGGYGRGGDRYGDGSLPPGVTWTFRTTGTDSLDVERFTVWVRYLGVTD